MNRLNILIAEDESLTRMDLREMLEHAGHLVCAEANNGVKAVELAKRFAPDLAILDIKMPGLDGIEVAKIMYSMNIPAIMLTAYSQQNFINRAEKVYVYGYLVKPVTERDLLPTVQIAFARWAEMQSIQSELRKTRQQLDSQKTIAHAKSILSSKNGLNALEAHQVLIRMAMDARVRLVDMAKQLIASADADSTAQ